MPFPLTLDIILKVKDKTGQQNRFRISRGAQLKRIKELYCKVKSVDPETLLLLFKGRPLDIDLTIYELQLEDGDVIEAVPRQSSFSDKDIEQMHQKSKSSRHSKPPASVNGSTIDGPSVHLEKKMDDLLSVQQEQQQSQVDTSLQHQEEHKQLETKLDGFLSVLQQQQREIDTLLHLQQDHCKQLEMGADAQQSQINTLLNDQQERGISADKKMEDVLSTQQQQKHHNLAFFQLQQKHATSLDKKTDDVLSVQQQQQSQIDALLHHQQKHAATLDKKTDDVLSVQQQQQSQVDALLQHQQKHAATLGKKIDDVLSTQQQQQSQVDALLQQQQELENKSSPLVSIQQQQSQIYNLLLNQQEHSKLLEAKMGHLLLTQKQQQSEIGTLLHNQQEHGMLLADIISLLSPMRRRPPQTAAGSDVEDDGWSLA